jgi:hypothetical protein
MNVEIGAEAALFPEEEYINGIFVAVQHPPSTDTVESEGRQMKQC